MPFGSKEKITKEDLIELGLDPALLKELKEKGVTKEMLDTMKTELTTTMTDQIKAGFTELENKLKPQPRTNDDKGNNGNDDTPDDITRFATDPTKFVKDEVNNLRGQAAVEIMKTRRDIALSNAQNTLKGFKNTALSEEIMKELDEKYDAVKMVRYGSDPVALIKSVHDMVLGRHHDEILQDSQKKDGKYNLVHSGSSVTNNNNNRQSTDNKPVISDQDRIQMAKFGMTEAEWIQQGVDSDKENLERRGQVA